MKDKAYVVLSRKGVVRMTKTSPGLRAGEVSMLLSVNAPDELFQRPLIKATVEVDKDAVAPVEIDAGTLEAIGENIRQGIGVDVALDVIEREAEDE